MPLFSLLRTNESTVKRRGGESEKVVTQISVLVFLGIEVFYYAKHTRKNEGKTSTDLTVSICGVKVFQYFNQYLDSKQNQNHVRLSMDSQPSEENLSLEQIPQPHPTNGIDEEDIHYILFKHTHPFIFRIFDKVLSQYKYSSIKSDIEKEDWHWVVVNLAQKFEELKSNREVMPRKKFEEFANMDWEATATILRKNQMEARIPLETRCPSLTLIVDNDLEATRRNIEQYDKIPYNSLEHLLRRIESIKEYNEATIAIEANSNVLFSNFNLECHSHLYKMALDGSLFEEGGTIEPQPSEQQRQSKTISLDELKGQINVDATRFFAVMYVVAKLQPTLNDIQYTERKGKQKAAKEALDFVKKNYNLLPIGVKEKTLIIDYTKPKKWAERFCRDNFKQDHYPTIATYLKAVLPDKANEIESVLTELNQSK